MREPGSNPAAGAVERMVGSKELLDALPIGICCCDLDGVVWHFNSRAAALWGRKPEIGNVHKRFCGAYKLFLPDGTPLPHHQTPMAEVLRTGKPMLDRRMIVERPDGTRLAVLANIEPLFTAEGTFVGALNCFQDMGEISRLHDARQHSKDALPDSFESAAAGRLIVGNEGEQYFRHVLEGLKAAIYTTDPEGRITFCNRAAAELAGREPRIGADKWCVFWRLYYPDGTPMPREECPMAIALREKRPVESGELIAERPDGSRIRCMPHPTLLYDREGRLYGAANMLVDITARHQAEVSSAHLAAIVSSSTDAIVSKTLDGTIQSWNSGATQIFGYEAAEMIGQPITRIIPPELHWQEQGILSRLRRGERVEHFETERLTKDGQRIDISLSVSPIHDKFGRVIGASKVARDISERKRAEELQRLLIGELNHRVKNTLATVQSIANQTVRLTRSQSDFAASFSGRIQSLAHTHDLLTRSSWQGAELLLLMRHQLLLNEAEDERITLSGPSFMLDPQPALHLALVVHELATNARKYGSLSVPDGRLLVNWTVRTGEDGRLLLQWQESGGPPVQVPTARGFGSTLIERSLAAHGGEVLIHYRAEGVRCDISLPVLGRTRTAGNMFMLPEQMAIPPATTALPAAGAVVAGRRVLVVEDEALISLDIVATLTEVGCVVVGPASTQERAFELIETEGCELVLLDANLDGRPVDEIAAALTRKNIPFAFMTGYGREDLPQAFRQAPIVNKPFTREDAIDIVGRLTRKGEAVVPMQRKTI